MRNAPERPEEKTGTDNILCRPSALLGWDEHHSVGAGEESANSAGALQGAA